MKTSLFRRPEIGATTAAVVVALYLLAATNLTFWRKAVEGFATTAGLAAFGLATLAIFLAVTIALAFRYLAKPFYIFAILSAAGASYFTDTYGTVINANMMENVLATNSGESGEFFTPNLLLHMLIYGVVPSVLLLWLRVRHQPLARAVRRNAALSVGLMIVAGLLVWPNVGEVRAAMRRDFNAMMEVLNPAGPVSAAVRVATGELSRGNRQKIPVGEDATRGAWLRASPRPLVAVVVVGESARAMNFSLNGYGRNTNPELGSRHDILSFRDVTSCGTETSIALRCMFTDLGRQDFSKDKALARESLMDVFARAGFDVRWWDNDGGAKGVADGVAYESYLMRNHPDLCLAGTCQDDIFLDDLDHALRTITRDTVIVLHQRGSHGPAYYLRYPDTFGPFRPDCRDDDLPDCSRQEILNAYDNTIAYTDRFLARTIGLIEKHAARTTGLMFFVSDHGESLGENGIYMHGARFETAPREQTHVPLIVWTSPDYRSLSGFDSACAGTLLDQPFSHDNVYATLLGLANVETSVYQPSLDIFSGCRRAEEAPAH